MLLARLLKGLLRRPPVPVAPMQNCAIDLVDDLAYFRTLRVGRQNPSLLVAHARWQATRDPLLAAALLQEAARREPQASEPLRELGELHLDLGNRQSAAEAFHTALLRNEKDAWAWRGLARARQSQGRVADARYAETRAALVESDRRPASADFRDDHLRDSAPALPETDDWPAWRDYLSAAEESGHQIETEALLDERVTAASDALFPRIALSLWLCQHARPRAAYHLAKAAFQVSPDRPAAILALAMAQGALGQTTRALGLCRQALDRHHNDSDLRILYADCLGSENDNAAALVQYRRILACRPAPSATLLNNYGCTLTLLEQFAEAIGPLREALALTPNMQKARLNLAYALTYLGQREEALALLDHLLIDEPHHFNARWYRSHLLLANHDFSSGWADYRYRFVAAATAMRLMPMPRWDGQQPLENKRLLITAEQGVGDEIMFASCLPDLMAMQPRVTLECDPRLAHLFARSFPGITLAAKLTSASDLPVEADYHLPAGDLPGLYRQNIDSFRAARSPFLVPDKKLVADFDEQLSALGAGLKVGIAWRGGTVTSRQTTRSLPLDKWAPLLSVAGCRFVSLQHGDCAEEISNMRAAGFPISYWPHAIADLDAFAALVAALDLVITVCSAPAHFAGGLGCPAWVLAPYAPEWRYTTLDNHMLWYPGVELLYQAAPGDWNILIQTTANRLKDRTRMTTNVDT